MAALCLACGHEAPEPPRAPGPPNVVVISLDTLRPDHLGLYGYERPTSPNLDALARESVVFERATSAASATQPAHNALWQSRLASHTGPHLPALPEVFRDHGYATAGFTGGSNVSAYFGFARGFEVYEEDYPGFALTYPKLEAWLRDRATEPFFLFVHSYDVHHPYVTEAPFGNTFFPDYQGNVDGPATAVILNQLRKLPPFEDFRGKVSLTPDDRAKIVALYDDGILLADHYVGRLLSLLKELELWDDTIVVLLSDHGEEFWEHGNVTHAYTLYEEVLRVPLLWRLPADAHAGLRVRRRVHLMDVAPTLLDFVGIPAPASFRGQSLLPFDGLDSLDANGATPGTRLQVSEMSTLKSVTDFPWKLIKEYPDGRRHLAEAPLVLYNLERDPDETLNIARFVRKQTAALEAELEQALAAEDEREVHAVAQPVDDPELRARLEALGYAVEEPQPAPAPTPDPAATPGGAPRVSPARSPTP